MLLGRTQRIAVQTRPPGAVATLAGQQTTTPGSVTIRRNQPAGWAVLRAEHSGYRPACRLVGGPRNVAFIVLDSIFFMAVPLLVDATTVGIGSLRTFPDQVHLSLRPLADGEQSTRLPSDEEILEAWGTGQVNLCLDAGARKSVAGNEGLER